MIPNQHLPSAGKCCIFVLLALAHQADDFHAAHTDEREGGFYYNSYEDEIMGRFQTKQTVLQVIILGLFLGCFASLSYSQPFTSVNYNFYDVPASHLLTGATHHGEVVSIASNGYGQWAVVREGEYIRWVLYADSIANYNDTALTGVVPHGEIVRGTFPVEYTGYEYSKVSANTISGDGFYYGIRVNGSIMVDGSSTFLCSNTITGITGVGILTDHWRGYGILNHVDS